MIKKNNMKKNALVPGDTLKIRQAIDKAIEHSKINKPVDITEEVDDMIIAYAERMSEFNFGNNILETERGKKRNIEEQKAKNKLILETNAYYAEKFPNNTVIPLSDLTKILEKYELYSGSTRFYHKLTPPKNLKEIKDFWEKSEKTSFGIFSLDSLYNLTITEINQLTDTNRNNWGVYSTASKKSLQIIAPLNEFTLTKEEKIIGKFIVHDADWDEKNIKKPQPINLDPIVWVPVKYPSIGGAALIITQWGPEADIPDFKKKNNKR